MTKKDWDTIYKLLGDAEQKGELQWFALVVKTEAGSRIAFKSADAPKSLK